MKESNIKELMSIPGGVAVDDRGSLRFVNNFDFGGVKRFYQVSNFSNGTIRAFHGHLKEGKYVYVTKGAIILAAVQMDHPQEPNRNNKVSRFILSSQKPEIIFIPPGYANGFRSLENDTQVIFFSTSTLEESKGDDYRFPSNYWGDQIWEVENR